MKINFTKRTIEALPTPKSGRALFHDTQVHGLVLTVQPSGERAFAWYRKVRRYPRWRMLGRFPDMAPEQARGKASEYNARLASGLDPFQDDALTFAAAFERYVTEHLGVNAKKPEREMSNARTLARHLVGWTNLPVNQLRNEDVRKMHSSLKARHSLWVANRVLQVVKAALNWAIREHLFPGPNVAAGISLYEEPSRKRYLEPNELPRLFKALNRPETSDDLRHFVNLALFTGARRSDVASMRWQDVHMSATGDSFWTVPDPKNRVPYNIALVAPALRVLAERKRQNGHSPWVFPNPKSASGHLENPKKTWTALRKRAGIPDVRFHDLRRTLGSWQAARGTSLLVIGKSLGHQSTGSTEVYSQLNLDPVRASVDGAVKAMLTAGRKRK